MTLPPHLPWWRKTGDIAALIRYVCESWTLLVVLTFIPSIRHATVTVKIIDPEMSKVFTNSHGDFFDVLARFGPEFVGVKSHWPTMHAPMKGSCMKKAPRQPRVSQRKPPNAAPVAEPRPKPICRLVRMST